MQGPKISSPIQEQVAEQDGTEATVGATDSHYDGQDAQSTTPLTDQAVDADLDSPRQAATDDGLFPNLEEESGQVGQILSGRRILQAPYPQGARAIPALTNTRSAPPFCPRHLDVAGAASSDSSAFESVTTSLPAADAASSDDSDDDASESSYDQCADEDCVDEDEYMWLYRHELGDYDLFDEGFFE